MKNIHRIIPVFFFVFLMLIGSSCMTTAKPDPTKIFEARRVYSIDYDPGNQTLYLIWSEDQSSSQNPSQVISSFHLASGQETVLISEIPYLFQSWIAVGRNGEVYVLDNGRNITHDPNKEPNVRSLLVLEENVLSHTYTIEYLSDEEPTPFTVEEANITYLGLERTEDALFSPKFILVETTQGEKQLYDPAYASADWTEQSLDYYLENNIQNLNSETFIDTHTQDREIWVNQEKQFKYREQTSPFLLFGNSPCERVYDLVYLQGKRYNMGQCIRGIHLFATSGHFFTDDNQLIYVSSGGVYQFGP